MICPKMNCWSTSHLWVIALRPLPPCTILIYQIICSSIYFFFLCISSIQLLFFFYLALGIQSFAPTNPGGPEAHFYSATYVHWYVTTKANNRHWSNLSLPAPPSPNPSGHKASYFQLEQWHDISYQWLARQNPIAIFNIPTKDDLWSWLTIMSWSH